MASVTPRFPALSVTGSATATGPAATPALSPDKRGARAECPGAWQNRGFP